MRERGHSRKSSYEPPPKVSSAPGLPMTSPRRSQASLSSLPSTASLTSPVLRRFSQRDGSLQSRDSSASFVSATDGVITDHSVTSSGDDDETLTRTLVASEMDSLWFGADRDNTLGTVVDANEFPGMRKQLSAGSRSSRTDSVASFKSAVSSQRSSTSNLDAFHDTYVQLDDATDATPQASPTLVHTSQDERWRQSGSTVTFQQQSLPTPPQRESLDIEDDGYLKPINVRDLPSTGDFVNLHGQLNQPITKSPLLMSCYTTHMTKLMCAHWSAPPPHPHGAECNDAGNQRATHLAYQQRHGGGGGGTGISGDPLQSLSWIPQFAYVKEGFTPGLMVNKAEPFTPDARQVNAPTTADWKRNRFFSDSMPSTGTRRACVRAPAWFFSFCTLLIQCFSFPLVCRMRHFINIWFNFILIYFVCAPVVWFWFWINVVLHFIHSANILLNI